MCKHGTETPVAVTIPADLSHNGKAHTKVVGIDSCIAPLVAALETAGIAMHGSCCGHDQREGEILLADGRVLVIQRSSSEPSVTTDAMTQRFFDLVAERSRAHAELDALGVVPSSRYGAKVPPLDERIRSLRSARTPESSPPVDAGTTDGTKLERGWLRDAAERVKQEVRDWPTPPAPGGAARVEDRLGDAEREIVATKLALPISPDDTLADNRLSTRALYVVEKLSKDAARLDWLESVLRDLDAKAEVFFAGLGTSGAASAYQCELAPVTTEGPGAWRAFHGKTLREAIDSARASTAQDEPIIAVTGEDPEAEAQAEELEGWYDQFNTERAAEAASEGE